LAGGKVSIAMTYIYVTVCISRLASLDVRIAHVHGVGVITMVVSLGVTADVKHDFHYVRHD